MNKDEEIREKIHFLKADDTLHDYITTMLVIHRELYENKKYDLSPESKEIIKKTIEIYTRNTCLTCKNYNDNFFCKKYSIYVNLYDECINHDVDIKKWESLWKF